MQYKLLIDISYREVVCKNSEEDASGSFDFLFDYKYIRVYHICGNWTFGDGEAREDNVQVAR